MFLDAWIYPSIIKRFTTEGHPDLNGARCACVLDGTARQPRFSSMSHLEGESTDSLWILHAHYVPVLWIYIYICIYIHMIHVIYIYIYIVYIHTLCKLCIHIYIYIHKYNGYIGVISTEINL